MAFRRKRRSNLGRSTRSARELRKKIQRETPEQRKQRLTISRERAALRRATETPEERETRLSRSRQSQRNRRHAKEESMKRNHRLLIFANQIAKRYENYTQPSSESDVWANEVNCATNCVAFIEIKQEPVDNVKIEP